MMKQVQAAVLALAVAVACLSLSSSSRGIPLIAGESAATMGEEGQEEKFPLRVLTRVSSFLLSCQTTASAAMLHPDTTAQGRSSLAALMPRTMVNAGIISCLVEMLTS